MGHPTRESLLDKALALITRRGFDATSVPAIAEAAGVAVGTVYRHFISKDELLNHLMQRELEAFWRVALADFDPRGDAPTQFRGLWHALVRVAQERRHAFELLQRRDHERVLDADTRALNRALVAPVLLFFERMQLLGGGRDLDAPVCFAMTWGALGGLLAAGPVSSALARATGDAVWSMLAADSFASPASGAREDWRVW